MYLTDYREYCLKDVIEQLEPELFRKVTGLTLKDFSLLVSLGVFNSELMNDAVYKFKRYEDSSLEYTGIDKHKFTVIGLWDTAIYTSKNIEKRETQNATLPDPVPPKSNPWNYLQIGDIVIHKSFGKGEVIALLLEEEKPSIIVKFPYRESRFLFPSVFEKGYLIIP